MSGLSATGRVVIILSAIVWLSSFGIGHFIKLMQDNNISSHLYSTSESRIRNRTNNYTLHLSPGTTNSTKHKNNTNTVTIVVQLSGELGNNLNKIGNGFCIQHHIERELGIHTEIKLRAQDHPKWKHAMEWVKAAFPHTRTLDFREMNTPAFDEAQSMQMAWIDGLVEENQLNVTNITNIHMMNDASTMDMVSLDNLLNLVNQTWRLSQSQKGNGSTAAAATSILSTPHVYSTAFISDYCLDIIYDDLRNFFALDENANCKTRPYPNETVLHVRNYIAEMPKRGMGLGFEELDSIRTATELFAEHEPGENVAIISRMNTNIQKYIDVLEMKGLKVRYITGQTGNEDFCFLAKASKEIIGTTRSTYAYWAGIIGDAKKVRLYSIDTPQTRRAGKHYYSYNYTNPELKERFSYENY